MAFLYVYNFFVRWLIIIEKIGFVDALLSAFIFGTMPVFTKSIYEFGVTPIEATFFRTSLSLIFIYIIGKFVKKCKMGIYTKAEFKDLVMAGFLSGATNITLYSSYNYILSGSATSIHFLYPIVIFILSTILYKTKPSKMEIVCILLSCFGLSLIADYRGMTNYKGFLLALASAFTFAFHSMYLETKTVKKLPQIKVLFYINVFACLSVYIYALAVGSTIKLNYNFNQYIVLFAYSLVLTLGGVFLYQRAVGKITAKYTSIMCTIEPIISIVIGYLVLGEVFSSKQILAAFLIVSSAILLIREQSKSSGNYKIKERKFKKRKKLL